MVVLLCGHQQSFTTWNHVTWHIEVTISRRHDYWWQLLHFWNYPRLQFYVHAVENICIWIGKRLKANTDQRFS